MDSLKQKGLLEKAQMEGNYNHDKNMFSLFLHYAFLISPGPLH